MTFVESGVNEFTASIIVRTSSSDSSGYIGRLNIEPVNTFEFTKTSSFWYGNAFCSLIGTG